MKLASLVNCGMAEGVAYNYDFVMEGFCDKDVEYRIEITEAMDVRRHYACAEHVIFVIAEALANDVGFQVERFNDDLQL